MQTLIIINWALIYEFILYEMLSPGGPDPLSGALLPELSVDKRPNLAALSLHAWLAAVLAIFV